MQCGTCNHWVHAKCEDLTGDFYSLCLRQSMTVPVEMASKLFSLNMDELKTTVWNFGSDVLKKKSWRCFSLKCISLNLHCIHPVKSFQMSCMKSCPACQRVWCIRAGRAVWPSPALGESCSILSSGRGWRRCWLACSPPPLPSTLLPAHR